MYFLTKKDVIYRNGAAVGITVDKVVVDFKMAMTYFANIIRIIKKNGQPEYCYKVILKLKPDSKEFKFYSDCNVAEIIKKHFHNEQDKILLKLRNDLEENKVNIHENGLLYCEFKKTDDFEVLEVFYQNNDFLLILGEKEYSLNVLEIFIDYVPNNILIIKNELALANIFLPMIGIPFIFALHQMNFGKYDIFIGPLILVGISFLIQLFMAIIPNIVKKALLRKNLSVMTNKEIKFFEQRKYCLSLIGVICIVFITSFIIMLLLRG